MKKILLTTTAMVAFAGAASAEVTLSGYAEMGIKGGDTMETQFHDDIDISFSLSGETDNGLTFGAKIDLDEADVGIFTGGTSQLNAVFISGGFGTLTLGDTDGALDWALTDAGDIINPGSLLDETTTHAGYNGSYLDGAYDSQILRYNNTFGDFGVAISTELDDSAGGVSAGFAVGVKYNLDLGGTTIALGLGHQQTELTAAAALLLAGTTAGDSVDATGISASATFGGGFSAAIEYTMINAGTPVAGIISDGDHIGVGIGYTTGALSMHANYGQYDWDDAAILDSDGFGLAVGYDLGGGASVLAGYMSSDAGAGAVDTWSLGLALSF